METGEKVYFTVSDASGSGTCFTINLREAPILDSLGVQLKGDIRLDAVPPVPGGEALLPGEGATTRHAPQ